MLQDRIIAQLYCNISGNMVAKRKYDKFAFHRHYRQIQKNNPWKLNVAKHATSNYTLHPRQLPRDPQSVAGDQALIYPANVGLIFISRCSDSLLSVYRYPLLSYQNCPKTSTCHLQLHPASAPSPQRSAAGGRRSGADLFALAQDDECLRTGVAFVCWVPTVCLLICLFHSF